MLNNSYNTNNSLNDLAKLLFNEYENPISASQGYDYSYPRKRNNRFISQNTLPNEDKIFFYNNSSVDWNTAKKDIFASLSWSKLQIGERVEVEDIIEDLFLSATPSATMKWIYDLVLNNTENVLLLCTLLHALSHIDYDKVYPNGPMFAMAMLSSKDRRVVAYAMKAFSNWNDKDSLKYANNIAPQQDWAKKEWNRIVSYIEKNGD